MLVKFQVMKYTLVNRKHSTFAKSNADFVRWMRRQDLQYFEDNAEFMQAYAARKATFEGDLTYGLIMKTIL